MASRARPHGALGFALFALVVGAAGATPATAAEKPAECVSCHEQGQKLDKSAHAGLTCDTCHERHEAFPHPANIPKPQCITCHQDQADKYADGVHGQARKHGNEGAPDCGMCHGSAHELLPPKSQAFRSSVVDTCGLCHTDVVDQYRTSVHGKAMAQGIAQAPLCTDCHGEHDILKHTNTASPVNEAHIRDTCGSCHGNVRLTRAFGLPSDRLVSFDSSFHGLAYKSGDQTVANCASCHGVHNILPSTEAKSTINAKNLPATCGKCHPGAGTRFAISQIHVVEGRTEPAGVKWVREFYLLVIPVTLGLMFLHNAGDWIRKTVRIRLRAAVSRMVPGHREVRVLPFERVQHALLAVSFVMLAWTGFALKYPDQWWARPLLLMEGRWPVRGVLHRTAAVIFVATAITHLISIVVNRGLRRHWKEMLPKARDAREALAGFAYNLGLGKELPVRSPHSYIEKAEYWALIWGTVVMAATGLLLWANNLALKLFPKVWLDVATSIHFYEAILAAAAIVIWHFYSTIFDPDVYPLDTAFLTGFSVKKEAAVHQREQAAEVHALEPHAAAEPQDKQEAPAAGD
jgi:cytochrome b subunit of formate dehydrogenase